MLCVSNAKIIKFSVPKAVDDIGIRPGQTVLDILPKETSQEIQKFISHIGECFKSKNFSSNSEDHLFNVDLKTIIHNYFVSY